MEPSAEYLMEKLQRDLTAEHVAVEDNMTRSRCACSFGVLAVSTKFERKSLLQRHRLVNACLAEGLLHISAFEQKTLIPEQWARER
ncbi:bolA-like protein 2 isoform X2 [Chlorocebus sabaeus]|uniref:bolA-like protein 2 isoform X2 n=1 Tax=Chlorocebus sabaeus TaxID=60711 RepID=UPI003BF9A41D